MPGVLIPFIAGQWSLQGDDLDAWEPPAEFQSPSLRGSGRFDESSECRPREGGSFNPLHCGAVVASASPHGGGAINQEEFQSPSLRGSGRFDGTPPSPEGGRASFNPLHCGAVVASSRRQRCSLPESRFNPLHCGAVVASNSSPV